MCIARIVGGDAYWTRCYLRRRRRVVATQRAVFCGFCEPTSACESTHIELRGSPKITAKDASAQTS